jgi:hypothetical protein
LFNVIGDFRERNVVVSIAKFGFSFAAVATKEKIAEVQ